MRISTYPKVLALGHRYITGILEGDVIVEEKIDGSQNGGPKNIGTLLKVLHTDIEEEEQEHIKTELYKHFIGDIKRGVGMQ